MRLQLEDLKVGMRVYVEGGIEHGVQTASRVKNYTQLIPTYGVYRSAVIKDITLQAFCGGCQRTDCIKFEFDDPHLNSGIEAVDRPWHINPSLAHECLHNDAVVTKATKKNETHKCNCDIILMMNVGCKCGGV